MAYKVIYSKSAERALDNLDSEARQRILDYMGLRVAVRADPRSLGRTLHGRWSRHYRFRVGDYRIVCRIDDAQIEILVVAIGHRSAIYDV